MNYVLLEKPDLSNEELFVLAKNGDEKAKEQLFSYNTRFCGTVARKYANAQGVEIEDLVSMAKIGLLKAYNTFSLDKEIKFITYASRCMENEILMYFRNQSAKAKYNVSFLNIEGPASAMEGNKLRLIDVIPNPEGDCPDEVMEIVTMLLNEYKAKSNDRDWEILYRLYFNKEHQKIIAEDLGITQSYVSRIEKKILHALRSIYEEKLGEKIVVDKEKAAMKKISDARKYIYINKFYPDIKRKYKQAIIGISTNEWQSHYNKFYKGEYDYLEPDASIENKIQRFLETKEIV